MMTLVSQMALPLATSTLPLLVKAAEPLTMSTAPQLTRSRWSGAPRPGSGPGSEDCREPPAPIANCRAGRRRRATLEVAIHQASGLTIEARPGQGVQVPVHYPLCVDAVPVPDAIGQGEVDSGRLYPELGDVLPLGLQEREAGEERGDLVAARGRDELEQETSLVAAPLVEALFPPRRSRA